MNYLLALITSFLFLSGCTGLFYTPTLVERTSVYSHEGATEMAAADSLGGFTFCQEMRFFSDSDSSLFGRIVAKTAFVPSGDSLVPYIPQTTFLTTIVDTNEVFLNVAPQWLVGYRAELYLQVDLGKLIGKEVIITSIDTIGYQHHGISGLGASSSFSMCAYLDEGGEKPHMKTVAHTVRPLEKESTYFYPKVFGTREKISASYRDWEE